MRISRRGFVSMLALAGAGAVLLPNRKFFLPPWRRQWFVVGEDIAENLYGVSLCSASHPFSNVLSNVLPVPADLSEASLEHLIVEMSEVGHFKIRPSQVIVPPRVAREIQTEGSVYREAALQMFSNVPPIKFRHG